MKTFKELMQELDENRFATYGSSMVFATKIAKLADKIKHEKDTAKKLEYLALQNKYIGYMNGINASLAAKKDKTRRGRFRR
jgi:pterin-4a-carbinolamine dehydratase